MSWSPDIGREIRSNGGFSIPHPAVVDTKPTLQAVTSSAENNPEISVQRIEVDIVREELLDENDVT